MYILSPCRHFLRLHQLIWMTSLGHWKVVRNDNSKHQNLGWSISKFVITLGPSNGLSAVVAPTSTGIVFFHSNSNSNRPSNWRFEGFFPTFKHSAMKHNTATLSTVPSRWNEPWCLSCNMQHRGINPVAANCIFFSWKIIIIHKRGIFI